LSAFRVARGERVLITGPSGCGKTTLLNLIAGLTRADSGSITVLGCRVHALSVSAADRFRGECIGLVFQAFQLVQALTVRDNILLAARYGHKWSPAEAKDRTGALLADIGLSARAHHRPSQLSIGEQQRVAIARALINEPPILLADEPTASLDRANADRTLELVSSLCTSRGTTVVIVSHDQSIAGEFDRVVDLSMCIHTLTSEAANV
jgi:putative ABC transport system ATP-binding protein